MRRPIKGTGIVAERGLIRRYKRKETFLIRKYESIWERIKTHSRAVLIAPSSEHTKIIMGVRKEKTHDEGYKLLRLEEGIKKRLKYKSNTTENRLELYLVDSTYITANSQRI